MVVVIFNHDENYACLVSVHILLYPRKLPFEDSFRRSVFVPGYQSQTNIVKYFQPIQHNVVSTNHQLKG